MFSRNIFVAGFIGAVGKDARDIDSISMLLEQIIVFDRHFNALDGKNGGILLIFGLLAVVLKDVLGDVLQPFVCHPYFVRVDASNPILILFIELSSECTDVFYRKT